MNFFVKLQTRYVDSVHSYIFENSCYLSLPHSSHIFKFTNSNTKECYYQTSKNKRDINIIPQSISYIHHKNVPKSFLFLTLIFTQMNQSAPVKSIVFMIDQIVIVILINIQKQMDLNRCGF